MNIFDLYGIKEVADVTFYDTATGAPVLFLDTLKVSTIEDSAETTEARGGKGNAALIAWDYGKEITLTLEDALFSMKSLGVLYGGQMLSTTEVQRAKKVTATTATKPTGVPATAKFYDQLGKEATDTFTAGAEYIAVWKDTVDTESIVINAESFPGTYMIVGDTYARNRKTGKDDFFQFVVPLAKLNSGNTLTMQAEGDPSTFTMTLRVLRPEDGNMLKLIRYPKTAETGTADENLIIDFNGGVTVPAGE